MHLAAAIKIVKNKIRPSHLLEFNGALVLWIFEWNATLVWIFQVHALLFWQGKKSARLWIVFIWMLTPRWLRYYFKIAQIVKSKWLRAKQILVCEFFMPSTLKFFPYFFCCMQNLTLHNRAKNACTNRKLCIKFERKTTAILFHGIIHLKKWKNIFLCLTDSTRGTWAICQC